jgi:hypothetical protein
MVNYLKRIAFAACKQVLGIASSQNEMRLGMD